MEREWGRRIELGGMWIDVGFQVKDDFEIWQRMN